MTPHRVVTALLVCALVVPLAATRTATAQPVLRAIVAFDGAVPSDSVLEDAGVRPLHRFASIPAVAVAGPRAAIVALGADRVEWDRPVTLFGDVSVRVTHAADVWGEKWWPSAFATDVHDEGRTPIFVDGEIVDGTGVTAGVVDSGINGLHPDLWYEPLHDPTLVPWEAKTLACTHFDVSIPDCDETVGHGTHVAGIIAGNAAAIRHGLTFGEGTNAISDEPGRPYLGVAPGADLVSAGLGAGRYILNAAVGLDWMYTNAQAFGIRVVNNSWGDDPSCSNAFPDNTITRISDRLVEDKDVVVVFAAGNYSGGPTWTNTYPRNPTPGVISVANYNDQNETTRDAKINGGSSDGCAGTTDPLVWTWPDVAAPGTSIMSTAAYTGTLITATSRLGFYARATGTSMAAPHVAGIVALMLQANPALTPAEVEQILIDTASPFDDEVEARGIAGPEPHWGEVNVAAGEFVDRSACRITPAHAADPSSAPFPRFDELPNPQAYVCRDFKRGTGLVDAYAAVSEALARAS